MRQSVTIGEFIEECYAYPYSKEYFELCQECAQVEIRDLARECMEFPESVEFIGTDFFESGPVSEPDYFMPYNESVFMEAEGKKKKEKPKQDDVKGAALLTRLFKALGKLIGTFFKASKKFLFGTKEDAKKVTMEKLDKFVKKQNFTSRAVRTMFSIAFKQPRGGRTVSELKYFSEKPFGTVWVPSITFAKDVTPTEKAAAKNFIGFLYAVAKKNDIKVIPGDVVWKKFFTKQWKSEKHPKGSPKEPTIADEYKAGEDQYVMSIKSIVSWVNKFNRTGMYDRSMLNMPKQLRTSAANAHKRGINIIVDPDKIDDLISELEEVNTKVDEIFDRKLRNSEDPGPKVNISEFQTKINELVKLLHTIIGATTSFHVSFKGMLHGMAEVINHADIVFGGAKKYSYSDDDEDDDNSY